KNKHRNIFIVADDDQLIYQWNGASNKRIYEFKNDYGADIIQLPDNFRCPPEVVNLANNLIAHNKGRLNYKEPIRAMKKIENDSSSIRFKSFNSFEEETEWIVEDIQKRINNNDGSSYSVIARS